MISLKWGFSIANLYSLPGLFSWSYLENGLWFPMISSTIVPRGTHRTIAMDPTGLEEPLQVEVCRGGEPFCKSPDVSMLFFYAGEILVNFAFWHYLINHPTWISDTFSDPWNVSIRSSKFIHVSRLFKGGFSQAVQLRGHLCGCEILHQAG